MTASLPSIMLACPSYLIYLFLFKISTPTHSLYEKGLLIPLPFTKGKRNYVLTYSLKIRQNIIFV